MEKLLELMLTLFKGLDLISVLLKGLDPGQSGEKKGERAMEPGRGVECRDHQSNPRQKPCNREKSSLPLLVYRGRAPVDSPLSQHGHSRKAYSLSHLQTAAQGCAQNGSKRSSNCMAKPFLLPIHIP